MLGRRMDEKRARPGILRIVDLAGRYSKRADLQKLEATHAKIHSGQPSGPRRRRERTTADSSRAPRRIERRLTSTAVEELIQAYRDGASAARLAAQYRISKTAVLTLLNNRDVPRRFQSMAATDIDHAERLYLAGQVDVIDHRAVESMRVTRMLRTIRKSFR